MLLLLGWRENVLFRCSRVERKEGKKEGRKEGRKEENARGATAAVSVDQRCQMSENLSSFVLTLFDKCPTHIVS
jgi:hypothetical protein